VHRSAIALALELFEATKNSKKDGMIVFRMHKGTLRLMSKDGKNEKVRSDKVYTIPNAEGATDKQLCNAIEEFRCREPLFIKCYNREA
jgi:hypothetical protein